MTLDLFEYEAVIEAAEAAPAGEPAGEPSGEPVAEAAGEPTGDPGAEQLAGGFDESFRSDPRFRDAVAEEAGALLQAQLPRYLEQYLPPAPGAAPAPASGQFDWTQVDPYGDDFGAQLGQGIQATIQQALQASLGPVTQTLEHAQQAAALDQGEQVAQDMIADQIARGGDVTDEGKNAIRGLAEAFMPLAVERYGESPRAAEAAIDTAYNTIRQIEQAAAQKAIAQHTNHVATLAGANGEPGIGTAGVGTVTGLDAAKSIVAGQGSGIAQKYSRIA